MINLLIELYDYPYGLNYYYIQGGEVKEFEERIANELKKKFRQMPLSTLSQKAMMKRKKRLPKSLIIWKASAIPLKRFSA